MFEHRFTTTRIATTASALLAAILIACGTTTGSAGRAPAETPGLGSNVRLTEFEYEGQGASSANGPEALRGARSTSAGGSADGSRYPTLAP